MYVLKRLLAICINKLKGLVPLASSFEALWDFLGSHCARKLKLSPEFPFGVSWTPGHKISAQSENFHFSLFQRVPPLLLICLKIWFLKQRGDPLKKWTIKVVWLSWNYHQSCLYFTFSKGSPFASNLLEKLIFKTKGDPLKGEK